MKYRNSVADGAPILRWSTVLLWGFVLQFLLPLVLLGSTAAGATVWVLASVLFFVIPCLLLPGRIDREVLFIAALIFLPPALFIGVSNLANGNSEGRDIADLFRTPYFLLAFVAGAKVSQHPLLLDRLMPRILRAVSILLVAYLVTSFVLRDHVDNLELLYGKIDNVVSARLFLPFPNPYDLALFATLPLFYFLLKGRLLWSTALILVLVGTQSRTGVLLLIVGLATVSLLSRAARRRAIAVALPPIVLAVVLFFLVFDLEDLKAVYLISNTMGLLEGHSTTLTRRFAQWAYLYGLPVLGWGTVRSSELVIENAVIYELYRMGLFGAYCVLCLYVFPVVLSLRTLIVFRDQAVQASLALFVLLTTVAAGTSVFIYQPKLSLMYWFATGAMFSLLRRPALSLSLVGIAAGQARVRGREADDAAERGLA